MTIQANIGIPIEGYFQLFYQSALAGELSYDEYLLAMQEFKRCLEKFTALNPRSESRRWIETVILVNPATRVTPKVTTASKPATPSAPKVATHPVTIAGLSTVTSDISKAGSSAINGINFVRTKIAGVNPLPGTGPQKAISPKVLGLGAVGLVTAPLDIGAGVTTDVLGSDILSKSVSAPVEDVADSTVSKIGDATGDIYKTAKSVGSGVANIGKTVAGLPLVKTGAGVAIGGALLGAGAYVAGKGLQAGTAAIGTGIGQGLQNLYLGATGQLPVGGGAITGGVAQPSTSSSSSPLSSLSPIDIIAILAAIGIGGYILVKEAWLKTLTVPRSS
jgi:hypothetical protein